MQVGEGITFLRCHCESGNYMARAGAAGETNLEGHSEHLRKSAMTDGRVPGEINVRCSSDDGLVSDRPALGWYRRR